MRACVRAFVSTGGERLLKGGTERFCLGVRPLRTHSRLHSTFSEVSALSIFTI